MQKMESEKLLGFSNEFELTCAAQDGNRKAWLALWRQYRVMMLSRLRAVKGLSSEECESEAIDVFSHKLTKFNRDKVRSEEAFSMFSWLFCGVVNRVDKLIRLRKKEVNLYFENVSASGTRQASFFNEDEDGKLNDRLFDAGNQAFFAYSPEKLVMQNIYADDSERIKAFYARLSPLDRDILDARRDGLTLMQCASKFHCSLTTVKNRIRKAKRCASDIFQVCYA